MKTILTIGGDRFLIPKSTDVSKLLDLFQGLTEVRGKTIYGPEGKLHFDQEFYRNVDVLDDRPTKFRVEIVHDDECLTQAEWGKVEAAIQRKIAALPPEKPASVASETLSRG